METTTIIYTDGSCLKNPGGPGGWAGYIIENNIHWCVSGNEKETTNNRMELKAVIESIYFAHKTYHIVYSDSKWVINCATNVWKRKANLDLWEEYDSVVKNKYIKFEWVKGHNGNKYNEIVDKIAKKEAKSIKI